MKRIVLAILVFFLVLSLFYVTREDKKKGDVIMIANGDYDVFIEATEKEFAPIAKEFDVEIGGVKIVELDELNKLISRFNPIKTSFGGSAANSAYTLSALGKRNGIYVVLSDEELSRGFIKDLEGVGVKNFGAYIPEKHRGDASVMTQLVAFITDAKTHKSERTFIAYKGLCADFTHVKFDLSHIKDYKILFIEGYVFSPKSKGMIMSAISEAKKHNVKVLFTPSSPFFVNMYKKDFWDIINQSDIVFTNHGEVKTLYENDDVQTGISKLSKEVDIAIVTNGNSGSLISSNFGKDVARIHEALDQSKAIDTTGAGDGYLAGFLYGYLNNKDMHTSGRLGAVVANHIVQEISGRPSKEMVERIKDKIHQKFD